VRGRKTTHARLRPQIDPERQVLARLENRLRHTPGRISAAQVDRTRALLREDCRLIVKALKIAAANAERMLARLFAQSYQCPQDTFSVFRALLQLPGQVTVTAPDRLEVHLHRPDSEKVARALENVLADLNREPPRLLGNGPILTFCLSDVNKNPLPTNRLNLGGLTLGLAKEPANALFNRAGHPAQALMPKGHHGLLEVVPTQPCPIEPVPLDGNHCASIPSEKWMSSAKRIATKALAPGPLHDPP
jgi:hypothetical protein